MSDKGRENIHPRLLALIDKTDKEEGLFIQDLQVGGTVIIRTLNHMYVLKILDPEERKVEATSNGRHFQEPTITCALGATLIGTGTMVKIGWLAVGYCFCLGGLILSSTQSISVNGVQLFPSTDEKVH